MYRLRNYNMLDILYILHTYIIEIILYLKIQNVQHFLCVTIPTLFSGYKIKQMVFFTS